MLKLTQIWNRAQLEIIYGKKCGKSGIWNQKSAQIMKFFAKFLTSQNTNMQRLPTYLGADIHDILFEWIQ